MAMAMRVWGMRGILLGLIEDPLQVREGGLSRL